jgi:DNA repair protein RecO (recombination protein O)
MTTSNTQNLTGFVLHQRKYRDTSLIVEFFSREAGRVSLLFKGVRRPVKKSGVSLSDLRLFQRLSVQKIGRGELPLAKVIDSAFTPKVLEGYEAIIGLYVNELMVRLTGRFEVMTELFDAYERWVAEVLDQGFLQAGLREFELTLLSELGYGIDFGFDAANGGEIDPDQWYHYFPGSGFGPAVDAGVLSFKGDELLRLAMGTMTVAGAQIVKQVVRQATHELLEGKPLRSRDLLEKARL